LQLEQFLERSAERFPEKIALVCGDRRLTYREIEQDCNRLAHGLIASGVQRGDRVAVYLDNSVEAVVSIFAVLKAGAVFLIVNPTTKSEKLAYILNNCRAAALITHAKKLVVLKDGLQQMPHLRNMIVAGTITEAIESGATRIAALNDLLIEHHSSSRVPAKRCIDIDLAALIYTSGSTGNPKGVMMTHLNMVTAARSITQYLENNRDDIILSALPLSFDYGLYQVLMGFLAGATVILEPSFAYPQVILERLSLENVTGFPLVPTMAAILLQMKGLSPGRFPRLRYITNTAAALPPSHIERLRGLFPVTRIYSMYGLTECKRVSYLPPDQLAVRPASVGKAIPNTEVYIVDERGERVGSGTVGELVVRGAHVMKGYWEKPDETDRVLKPGPLPGEKVLYTGDLFRMDGEGYLYFVGRKDDLIKTRGEKVSPKEVEAVIYTLPEVKEAAVIGVPDPILGQAIKAVLVLADGAALSERDVMRHCAARLEDFMVPKSVEFRSSLPKTTTGKISKRELGLPTGGR
jgi:amino acid adenylation domain-containing protein